MIAFFFKDADNSSRKYVLPCRRATWWKSGDWGTA